MPTIFFSGHRESFDSTNGNSTMTAQLLYVSFLAVLFALGFVAGSIR
jgi:hypothetical protein